MTILRSQSEIAAASNADLLETYNAMLGKSIKRFSSRAAAEAQTANALLAGVDTAAHAGVPKGTTTVVPKTLAEVGSTTEAITTKEEPTMATKGKTVKAKKAKAAPAAAKKAKAAPAAGRQNVYSHVKLTEPDVARRPQPGSKRTEVLTALRKRFEVKGTKSVAIDDLNTDCGFNTRSFVHKLVGQGWAEVVGAA